MLFHLVSVVLSFIRRSNSLSYIDSIEKRFVELCEKDKFCSSQLKDEIKQHGSVTKAWKAIFADLDSAKPTRKACADLLRKVYPNGSPSLGLRNEFSEMVGLPHKRLLVPAIMHRLHFCEAQDVKFLKFNVFGDPDAFDTDTETPATAYDQIQSNSVFLAQLIKASEMWTTPSPSWKSQMQDFDAGLFSYNATLDFATYCYFTADFSDPACAGLVELHPEINFKTLETPKFTYTPEKEYWKKFAKIPDHASALLFNGELDFLTTSEWGMHEYEGLEGEKMVVNFNYGGHGSGMRPSTFSDKTNCGYQIAASFVLQGGKVEEVDTSCMATLPPFSFSDILAIQSIFPTMLTADALYDSAEA